MTIPYHSSKSLSSHRSHAPCTLIMTSCLLTPAPFLNPCLNTMHETLPEAEITLSEILAEKLEKKHRALTRKEREKKQILYSKI